jgi:hypothetical protein
MAACFKVISGYHGYRGLSPIVPNLQRRIGDTDASNQKENSNPKNNGLSNFIADFFCHFIQFHQKKDSINYILFLILDNNYNNRN